MVAAIEEGTDRHSARAMGNAGRAAGAPPWSVQLRIAHDNNIHVGYAFIRTRSADALDWIAAEGTPQEWAATRADFNRYAEIKRRVEKAMSDSLADRGIFQIADSARESILDTLDAVLAQIRDGPIGGTLVVGKVSAR
jgi:hypothetical protein